MPCYSPLSAFQCADGDVVFVERRRDIVKSLSLPCGQCIGCRLERSRQWAVRCLHESMLHERNAFVTLTYSDEWMPFRGQLVKADFQKFMKRLRKQFSYLRIRYYMCGEYGPLNWRPHFHACLFGVDFDDKKFFKVTPSGESIYCSRTLDKLWPFGFASVGRVSFESAGYVARYCVQKVTGDAAKLHYRRVDDGGEYSLVPEYNDMSRRPGVGAGFLDKFYSDVYPRGTMIVNGKEVQPPKFYDRIFEARDPEAFALVQYEREKRAREKFEDNTDERLYAKRVYQERRAEMLIRSIE